MDPLTKEEKKANLEHYKSTIHHPRPGEPNVLVRVMVPPGLWWGPSPNMHKLYGEGEVVSVPEHVFLNSDYHNPRKSVNGAVIRGILERADMVKPAVSVANDDLKAVLERNRELERQIATLTGNFPAQQAPLAPPIPLVVPDKSAEESI